MRKLPAKTGAVMLPAVMAAFMTMIISAVTTRRVRGFDVGFSEAWLPAWGLSYAIAFPTITMLLPLVRRIVDTVVEGKG